MSALFDEPGTRLSSARARIAREVLAVELPAPDLGELTLYPHQRRAVARIRQLLRFAGGALLADATGLGKTFVALAVGATVERLLIIAPASLVDSWRSSAARACVTASIISAERLSRGVAPPLSDPELVIVDESHHFRNPRTRRYSALARICDRSAVLLLSATPLQNRRDDLVAELALFLGDTAAAASDDELARFVVRRRAGDDVGLQLPRIVGPNRIALPIEDDLLDELLALPAPVLGRDEGEAAALVSYTLLRQWSSSRAALMAGLRRRLAKALALTSSLEAGRWPSRDELLAWTCIDGAIQLALPEILSPLGDGLSAELSSLLGAVRNHAGGIRLLLSRIRASPDPDEWRATAIEDICRSHPATRVIAFSQYAETVHSLARVLMTRRGGVAELTARGGRVVGGRVSRREVLTQFAPTAQPSTLDCNRITLLVTTDVLSEGLDLQNASVVIHLDLPWNPARLEQRVGRVRRLGSPHTEVHVYAISPPASAERVLRVEARLRAKLRLASTIVGLDAPTLDSAASLAPLAPPELASHSLTVLERWRREDVAESPAGVSPVVAAVLAPESGLLAVLSAGEERLLLAQTESGGLSLDAGRVARVLASCNGTPVRPSDEEIARAMHAIQSWTVLWAGRRELSLGSRAGARCRARLAHRITELLARVPRHERAALAAAASRAHRALAYPLGAGAEHALAALAGARQFDARSLDEIAALAEGRRERKNDAGELVPLALVVLRRAESD